VLGCAVASLSKFATCMDAWHDLIAAEKGALAAKMSSTLSAFYDCINLKFFQSTDVDSLHEVAVLAGGICRDLR
jgi:hypothetical protein